MHAGIAHAVPRPRTTSGGMPPAAEAPKPAAEAPKAESAKEAPKAEAKK